MIVADGATPTGGKVTPTILASEGSAESRTLPPVWSASRLVLMMKRIGLGGAGELMIPFIVGLVHPKGAPGQCSPTQRLGVGLAATDVASCKTVESTCALIDSLPESTSRMPSCP